MLYPNATAYLAHLEANAEPLPNLPNVSILQGTVSVAGIFYRALTSAI